VAPDPTAVFFGDGYVNHRDHRELGWAVLDSLVPAASPLYLPDAGPAHQVGLLLLSGTLEADAWVDISGWLDEKVAAVACHESRLGGDPALVAELLEHRAAEEGARAGIGHAEAFRRLRFTS
jgi:LmbE family N-acetylglucosaminyl deacetylase